MKNLFLVLIFALPVSGQIKGNVQDPSGNATDTKGKPLPEGSCTLPLICPKAGRAKMRKNNVFFIY